MCRLLKKSKKTSNNSCRDSLRETGSLSVSWGTGKHEIVVNADRNHDYRNNKHDDHPSFCHTEQLNKCTGEINQSTCRCNLGYIVKRSLPTNPACLLLIGEHRYIRAVCRNIMCSTAHGNHRKDSYRNGKKEGKLSAKATNAKSTPVSS